MAAKKAAVQPEINIGLVGHVDHGKTTLTERLSGKWTDTHSEELKRGITIRLGYADTIFRKCTKCQGPDAYTVKETCPKCGGKPVELRKVSFVDAPGHESLMATMLAGATIMDGALLLVAANEPCPQPQTREHLMALEIIGVANLVVVQNKIDLVSEDKAIKNYEKIRELLAPTRYRDAPIVPISAIHNINIGALIEAIQTHIPTPVRDETKDPVMYVARSFDVNKPGTPFERLSGGVIGGSLIQGKLKVGQDIEIRPGFLSEERNQKVYRPILTKIVSAMTGSQQLKEMRPGGSIAIATTLDPGTVKSDKLTGAVVGLPGRLPDTLHNLALELHLLSRVVGTKDELTVEPIRINENLMLNVNSAATVGIVTEVHKETVRCTLKLPVCAAKGSRVTISRLIANRFRLIGYGILK